jgi:hypothetical protein
MSKTTAAAMSALAAAAVAVMVVAVVTAGKSSAAGCRKVLLQHTAARRGLQHCHSWQLSKQV